MSENKKKHSQSLDGLLECLCFSLPPSSLSLCGPDKYAELSGYKKEVVADSGLLESLTQFHTLYTYLSFIAYENNIKCPFDKKVVQAYWIGNSLLHRFSPQRFYLHLKDTLGLRKQLSLSELEILFGKIPNGALPHHAFHVLNIPSRTGHLPIPHTLDSVNSCLVRWGKVEKVGPEKIIVKTKSLEKNLGQLTFSKEKSEAIVNSISKNFTDLSINVGDLICFHWQMFCKKLTSKELTNLRYYTRLALKLVNNGIKK